MWYHLIKPVARLALRVFFARFKVTGKEHIPKDGPIILIANHPNTFMDPVILASLTGPKVFFLAKGSLFKGTFRSWLLKSMHLIPIYRAQDNTGTDLKAKNEQVFRKCYDFLKEKGTLLIFPEGVSIQGRHLHKIKTGTARISLGAEADADFSLDLKIIPFGLNYSNPRRFRSEVFVSIGEPLMPKNYQEDYEKNAFGAAQKLTTDIRETLEKLTIVTADRKEDELVRQIEDLYKSELSEEFELSEKQQADDFLLTKSILEALHHFRKQDPERVENLEEKLLRYQDGLEKLQLNNGVFGGKRGGSLLSSALRYALVLVLGFPLHLYGLLNNYLPYIIPSKVADLLTREPEYRAPIMMTSGIFTFSFFYILQIIVFALLNGTWPLTVLYALSLPASGFFSLLYGGLWQHSRNRWLFLSLFYKRSRSVSELMLLREELLKDLRKAKDDFLGGV